MNRALKINSAALALIVLAAGGLGGCGRAGPLEPPPTAETADTQTGESEANSGVPQARPKPKPIEAPKQSFFLDPLL